MAGIGMQAVLALVLVYVAAFLLGSIPSGVVIGRGLYGIDPRSGGSGNIGATNASRMLGAKGGAAVMVCDMLKGAVAVGIARGVTALCGFAEPVADALVMGSATVAIAGHIYSPWLGFKGGKGISTGFGSLLVASPLLALGLLVVFFVFAVATRIVSVGSVAAAASVTVFALLLHPGSVPFAVFALLTSVMVIYAHRANLVRLAHGEESKFSLGKGAGTGEKGDADD